jgi:hypothetical protein
MTFQSIQLGANNQAVNDDIASHVHPNNVLPDSQRHRVNNIVTRTDELHTFNSHSGATTITPKVTSVQMLERTGRVAIAGTTVAPEVYENLKETAPQLFVEPSEKVQAAAQVDAEAQAAEISREEANRHPGEIEGLACCWFCGQAVKLTPPFFRTQAG